MGVNSIRLACVKGDRVARSGGAIGPVDATLLAQGANTLAALALTDIPPSALGGFISSHQFLVAEIPDGKSSRLCWGIVF